MTLIADLFPKFAFRKTWLDICPKSLKGPFDTQHGKRVQTQLQSAQQDCHHIY